MARALSAACNCADAILGCAGWAPTLSAPGLATGPDDIEDAQARQAVEPLGVAREPPAGGIADIGEADRIELVQRRHLAARIPPLARQRRETRDLVIFTRGCARRRAGAGHRWNSVNPLGSQPYRATAAS